MPTSWPELTSLAAFTSLSDGDRLVLAARLAKALGPSYAPHPELVGSVRFAAVRHEPSALLFVAIPGE